MEYKSLPQSIVEGVKLSQRDLVDNSAWTEITTSVNTEKGEKYVLSRKVNGSSSCNVWTAEPLTGADSGAINSITNSPYWLNLKKREKKDEAKLLRDTAIQYSIFAALANREDYSTFESARAALMSEYSYIIGKPLSDPASLDRKAFLESLLEWNQLVAAELRALNDAIDSASNMVQLDAIDITFTPAP